MDELPLSYMRPAGVRRTSRFGILLAALGSGCLIAVGAWMGVRVVGETCFLIRARQGWARDFVELAAYGCLALCLFVGGLLVMYHCVLYLRSGTGSFAKVAAPAEDASNNA